MKQERQSHFAQLDRDDALDWQVEFAAFDACVREAWLNLRQRARRKTKSKQRTQGFHENMHGYRTATTPSRTKSMQIE